MASKWDDDDVERPVVKTKGDVRADINEWQAKVNAAAKTVALPAERTPVDVKAKQPAPVVKAPAVPALPEADIKRLQNEALQSANDVAHRSGMSRRVRLRVKVPGWYPGSVPAVDFLDGRPHFFAHAPSRALETAEEYLEYWRKPFVEQLRKLGFTILEEDI